MEYPNEQIEELKRYCTKLSILPEAGVNYLYMEGLRLPVGCTPATCDGLLRTVPNGGYPSMLHLSQQVTSPFTRNWNVTNARIGEKNWFAFSWMVNLTSPTLAQLLIAHLNGFAKEK